MWKLEVFINDFTWAFIDKVGSRWTPRILISSWPPRDHRRCPTRRRAPAWKGPALNRGSWPRTWLSSIEARCRGTRTSTPRHIVREPPIETEPGSGPPCRVGCRPRIDETWFRRTPWSLRWGIQRQRRGQVQGRFPEERQNRSSRHRTWDPRWPRSTICQWDTIESRPKPARTLRNRTLAAATVCQYRSCRKRQRYPATRGRSWIPTPCWCSDRWRLGAERSRWSVFVCRPTGTNWNLLMNSRVVPSGPVPTSPGSLRWWPGWWSGR